MCGCTSQLKERLALNDDRCNMKCPGSRRFCGGQDSFSVYLSEDIKIVWEFFIS